MDDDDTIRSALRVAGDEFRPNPSRLDAVLHRHARERRRRAGVAIGAVAAAVAVAALAGPAMWDRFVRTDDRVAAPGLSPHPVRILAARAVPEGVEVRFTSYAPNPPTGDPCTKAYDVSGVEGSTPGELVVTVTATWVSPNPTPDLVCNTVGFDRWILFPTTTRPETVRDSTSGVVFRIVEPAQPT